MRRRKQSVVTFIMVTLAATHAFASQTLLHDEFNDIAQWNDLSTAVTWGGHVTPTSVFDVAGGTVTMDWAAQAYSGYGNENQSLTFTAIDHQFDIPVFRHPTLTTVNLDFKARWDSRSLGGEGSRVVVTWTHRYPDGGLDMDLDDKYNDFTDDWWAAPAYNFRIRPNQGGEDSMIMFGGGHDTEGEIERYGSDWWLAGFSSGPGGHSPQPGTFGVEGAGEGIHSQSAFRNYRYQIAPTHQNVFFDANNNGVFEAGEKTGNQDISAEYVPHPTDGKSYRSNFHVLEGLRLYWRGVDGKSQIIFDDLTVTLEGPRVGDANTDGDVAFLEVAEVVANIGLTGVTGDKWSQGDFDGNGAVELYEAQYAVAAYNEQHGASLPLAAFTIPEPASLALLAFTAAALLRRRR